MSEIKTSDWILVNSQKENVGMESSISPHTVVGMESSISPHTVKTLQKSYATPYDLKVQSLQKDTLMGHMRRLARFGAICTIQKT